MLTGRPAASVAALFEAACLAELRAPKPGNVHDFAPGHRMTVADFEASAAAAAPAIGATGAPVGRRILRAAEATAAAVGTNTNLGILLLCAPLALAFEQAGEGGPAAFRAALAAVLDRADIADSVDVYAAIRIAAPAGLGQAAAEDVSDRPTLPLKAVMALAADRDTIARQYVTTFAEVMDIGLAAVQTAIGQGLAQPWITTAAYFAFASQLRDSHIERKFGPVVAEEIRRKFADNRQYLGRSDLQALLLFDQELKGRGLNPGTSADLTVATVFLHSLLHIK